MKVQHLEKELQIRTATLDEANKKLEDLGAQIQSDTKIRKKLESSSDVYRAEAEELKNQLLLVQDLFPTSSESDAKVSSTVSLDDNILVKYITELSEELDKQGAGNKELGIVLKPISEDLAKLLKNQETHKFNNSTIERAIISYEVANQMKISSLQKEEPKEELKEELKEKSPKKEKESFDKKKPVKTRKGATIRRKVSEDKVTSAPLSPSNLIKKREKAIEEKEKKSETALSEKKKKPAKQKQKALKTDSFSDKLRSKASKKPTKEKELISEKNEKLLTTFRDFIGEAENTKNFNERIKLICDQDEAYEALGSIGVSMIYSYVTKSAKHKDDLIKTINSWIANGVPN